MSRSKPRWLDVGALDDIPVRGARIIKTGVGCIAVFRTSESEAFAIDDRCPHKGGPLGQGIVHGRSVTCPLHNWVISLETGKALGADTGEVERFDVRIDGGRILLDVSRLASRRAA